MKANFCLHIEMKIDLTLLLMTRNCPHLVPLGGDGHHHEDGGGQRHVAQRVDDHGVEPAVDEGLLRQELAAEGDVEDEEEDDHGVDDGQDGQDAAEGARRGRYGYVRDVATAAYTTQPSRRRRVVLGQEHGHAEDVAHEPGRTDDRHGHSLQPEGGGGQKGRVFLDVLVADVVNVVELVLLLLRLRLSLAATNTKRKYQLFKHKSQYNEKYPNKDCIKAFMVKQLRSLCMYMDT
jgi:hypothetical protein